MSTTTATTPDTYPDRIETVDQLEELLSRPTDYLIDIFRRTPGDVIILGVAGKMGITLARMARRASDAAGTNRKIIGVAQKDWKSCRPRQQAAGNDPYCSARTFSYERVHCAERRSNNR